MANLDEIADRIRERAGADFAFVLTRKGRLVTRKAPRDMPEPGRARLVEAARPLIGTDKIDQVTMAREDLVPFGGAAPIDVFLGVAAEQAIVCVVMSTWSETVRVGPAIQEGLRELMPLLAKGASDKAQPRSHKRPLAPPAAKPPPLPVEATAPVTQKTPRLPEPKAAPKTRRTVSGLVNASGPTTSASPALEQAPRINSVPPKPPPRAPSMPEIVLGEAPLGRESLAAIEREGGGFIGLGPRTGTMPEITLGEAPLGRETLATIEGNARPPVTSIPEIIIGETVLGRESLAAVYGGHRPPLTSMPEQIRVELVSVPDAGVLLAPAPDSAPMTQPYVESPAEAKRYGDAARLARKVAPPAIRVRLETIDDEVVEAALTEPLGGPISEPQPSPRTTHPWDDPPTERITPSPRSTNPWDEPPPDRATPMPRLAQGQGGSGL